MVVRPFLFIKNVTEEVPSRTIKTGQIISVIYDGTNFQLLSGSGSGGIALPLYTNETLTTESNEVAFTIPNFDKLKDILFVYANSIFLQVGVDYTLSNTEITKVSGTWDSGTEFNLVCFQMVDVNPDALGIANIDSSFTATADATTHCLLNTSNYNPVNDVLYVYYQNVILFESVDYTVNADMVSIDLTSFSIDTGEILRYKILKKVRQDLSLVDGTIIQDGTVAKGKLSTTLQAEIDGIGDRQYTEQNYVTDGESVTASLDAIDTNLNLVQSGKANKVQESVKSAVLENSYTGSIDYFKDDFGVVHVWGEVTPGVRTAVTLIATLPSGYRPRINTPVVSYGVTSTCNLLLLQLYTEGELYVLPAISVDMAFIRLNFSFFAT